MQTLNTSTSELNFKKTPSYIPFAMLPVYHNTTLPKTQEKKNGIAFITNSDVARCVLVYSPVKVVRKLKIFRLPPEALYRLSFYKTTAKSWVC